MRKVVKFGGTSLASAQAFGQAIHIIEQEEGRLFVVPSAPGKRFSDDTKVTDLLYRCHATKSLAVLDEIHQRYQQIIRGLGLDLSLQGAFDEIARRLQAGCSVDYMASRGEYLNGLIMAQALGYPFVDAAEVIRFDSEGRLLQAETREALSARLGQLGRGVIPGFYGADATGRVYTFSRGGSDITGALVAEAMGVDVYENWTDVPGVLTTDPRIVPYAKPIAYITYRELRELSYMGASVLHEDAIFPARRAGIPIQIRDTFQDQLPGTFIVETVPDNVPTPVITGVAGHRGITTITMEKAMMNGEVGFIQKVLGVYARHGISVEHVPSGVDTLSVVTEAKAVEGKLDTLIEEIRAEVNPDNIEVVDHLAVIATVGRGMVKSKGIAARLFFAMAMAGINIRMIDQGSGELNIIIAIDEADFEKAIRAIYEEFFN